MSPWRQLPRRCAFAALALLCLSGPAQGQNRGQDQGQDQGRIERLDYGACMAMARQNPEKALKLARNWDAKGGGQAAQHCAAVSLIALGRHVEAGQRLEALADTMPANAVAPRARIFTQAGRAWLLAGEGGKAGRAFSRALSLTPGDVELLIDRSIARATSGQYWEAIDDLNQALDLAPDRADVLVLRGSAYRFLEATDLAADDLERALELDPDNPDGLLERGILRRLGGDAAGARADWTRILETAGDTPAAQAARSNLKKLDAVAN